MGELLSSLVDDFNLRSQKSGKTIVLKKEKLPRLMANRNDLYHIFQNLLDNALKYGADKKNITVNAFLKNQTSRAEENSSENKKEWIVVTVHNWGPVLSHENQERLFERFYRVNSTQKVEGTGLGLSIVQQLVQKYDGTITVSSAAETGTTFTVSFPLEF